MSPSKQHIVYLTVEEMAGLAQICQMLIDGEGRARLLEKIPISKQYVKDLQGAAEKLNRKLDEISE